MTLGTQPATTPTADPPTGPDRRELVAVFVGGAIGALLRAVLGTAVPAGPGEWPWATFVANIAAAFALGYATTRLLERLPTSSYRRPFIGTGLCGGLSTFSTVQVEVVRMLEAGAYLTATAYVLVSLVAGIVAVHVATAMVRRVRVRG
jgi:CrcB protein